MAFVLKNILAFFASAFLVVITLSALYIDIAWLQDGIKEMSATEIVQELMLAATVMLFLSYGSRPGEIRQGAVLIAGFFGCMLIREMDFLFDQIRHGSWVWFALLTALLSIGYCARKPVDTVRQLARFMRHPAYGMMFSGLLCILVFSRLFGMHFLWQQLMQEGYDRLVKNMVEEGVEFFGYALCLSSTCWYFFAGAWARGKFADAPSGTVMQYQYDRHASSGGK
ncbi:hypothetical protein MT962_001476 [Franconibacter sp. IITDAS19]|uniref:hypothetical protein n=1 Tax=Franconibacter sp. IITDAS19 TaxID=2930569 RepID=UPI001FF8C634|nr:hypothetical protein [Franconibacter sp. IITDAS19]MCK1967664.1 hypothetical protein [Franconibacter sp. IITDAS19]